MKEDVNVSMPLIEGIVKIEKFDSDGNLVHQSEGKNVIKQWVYDRLKAKMMSAAAAWNPRQSYEQGWNSFDTASMFRYVYLLDSATTGMSGVTPSATSEPCFPLKSGTWIGHLDRYNQVVGSDAKLGIINYEESYCTPTSAKFVYQWGTSKGVGTFDTVVHSQLWTDHINNNSSNEYSYGEKIVTVPIGPNRSVWKTNSPTMFCVFNNLSNELIVAHSPVLVGNDLQITEFNTVTGIINTVLVTSWGNDLNGSVPARMCAIQTPTKKTYVFSSENLNQGYNSIHTLTNSVWAKTNITRLNINGVTIDDTYVYIKEQSCSTLRRYLHNGTDSGTILIGDIFPVRVGNKIYSGRSANYFDISGATWTGEQYPIIPHKYSYVDITYRAGGQTLNGWYYWFISFGAYITGENNGNQNTSYALVKCPIESYRCAESAHYKHSAPITKGENETLKITYTFNFT